MFKVLIADDERFVRYAIRMLVPWEQEGFSIAAEARNGVEALACIRECRPDVALLDIRMPGLTGLDLLEQIVGEPHPYCIIISGYADFTYAQTALRFGMVTDYLLKPVETDALLSSLHRVRQRCEQDARATAEDARVAAGIPLDARDPAAENWLEALVRYIDMHIVDDIRLGELSRMYSVSIGHLSGLLKQRLGMNYVEYVTGKRLEIAKRMLCDTRRTVSDISVAVGYCDCFYFTKLFKRYTGQTPAAYRNGHQAGIRV